MRCSDEESNRGRGGRSTLLWLQQRRCAQRRWSHKRHQITSGHLLTSPPLAERPHSRTGMLRAVTTARRRRRPGDAAAFVVIFAQFSLFRLYRVPLASESETGASGCAVFESSREP